MSLNWNWNDKMGEVIYNDAIPNPHNCATNIYEGNALMIWVCENPTDNTYTLTNFVADMGHFRNVLGLRAKHGFSEVNLFNEWCENITKIRLNTKYKSVPKIVEAFAKAKTNITIELYYEE